MNKKEYKLEVEQELKRFNLENFDELLYQAIDGVNQVEEDNLIIALGRPDEYLLELLEMNEIEIDSLKPEKKVKKLKIKNKVNKPKEKKKKFSKIRDSKVASAKAKLSLHLFLGTLLALAGLYVALYVIDFHMWSNTLIIVAPVMLLIYSFITKGSVVEKALIITMIAIFSMLQLEDNYYYYIREINTIFVVSLAALIALNFLIVKPLEKGSATKKQIYKSVVNKIHEEDNTMDIKVALGQNKYIVKEDTEIVNIDANFANVIIDATNMQVSTKFVIDTNCAKITILLPEYAHFVDTCNYNFSSHKSNSKNIEGMEVKLEGNLTLTSLKY